MITDKYNTFAKATALNTGAAGTYLLGDVIDLTVETDIGQSTELYLVVTVETTATSAGAATLEIQLASDAQAAIATDGSATVHAKSATFAVTDLSAGVNIMKIELPREGLAYERYLGILQVTGVAAFTAGAINAFLTPNPSGWRAYPNNKQ